jgi:hypothetical protein
MRRYCECGREGLQPLSMCGRLIDGLAGRVGIGEIFDCQAGALRRSRAGFGKGGA